MELLTKVGIAGLIFIKDRRIGSRRNFLKKQIQVKERSGCEVNYLQWSVFLSELAENVRVFPGEKNVTFRGVLPLLIEVKIPNS